MGGGRKDMISSYNSSLSCSRLMSSLCTVRGMYKHTLCAKRNERELTIELEELRVQGRSDWLILWVVL